MSNAETASITLAEAIRIAIGRTGMTLAEVGVKLGVHEKTVGRWQRGATTPDFDQVVRLASLARMPLSTFADAVTPPSKCFSGHLRLVPALPGQLALDLNGSGGVAVLRDVSLNPTRRTVAARALGRTRLHAVR
jgi:transcriptional regulator with XRE-family HTH domain